MTKKASGKKVPGGPPRDKDGVPNPETTRFMAYMCDLNTWVKAYRHIRGIEGASNSYVISRL